MSRWAILIVVVVLSFSTAGAADTELSMGGEVSAIESDVRPVAPWAGGFVRLAVTEPVPDFTTRPRGYVWRWGPGVDVTLRRGDIDGEKYHSALVGLRYDITFSQRRMGLARVSGRGGFYTAVRFGVVRSERLARTGDGSVDVVPFADPLPPIEPAVLLPSKRAIASGVVGTYVHLGSALRLVTELGGSVMDGPDVDASRGAHIRVGLGVSL